MGCAGAVSAALKKVPGVVKVDCDPDKRETLVRFKPEKVSIDKLLETFKEAKFPAKLIKLEDA